MQFKPARTESPSKRFVKLVALFTAISRNRINLIHLLSRRSLGPLGSSSATILSDLTTASDHLPVVADYNEVGVPEPSASLLLAGVVLMCISFRRSRKSCAVGR